MAQQGEAPQVRHSSSSRGDRTVTLAKLVAVSLKQGVETPSLAAARRRQSKVVEVRSEIIPLWTQSVGKKNERDQLIPVWSARFIEAKISL